jgi:hypothetical protein
MRLRCSVILVCALSIVCKAKDDARPKTAAEAMDRASKLSQITLPGSAPFHLKATVAELGSPDSDYKAEIEEYWVAPDKWKRIVRSPEFSETMVVNGEKIFEQNEGNYFPFWLRDFLTARYGCFPGQESFQLAAWAEGPPARHRHHLCPKPTDRRHCAGAK